MELKDYIESIGYGDDRTAYAAAALAEDALSILLGRFRTELQHSMKDDLAELVSLASAVAVARATVERLRLEAECAGDDTERKS